MPSSILLTVAISFVDRVLFYRSDFDLPVGSTLGLVLLSSQSFN